MIETIKLPEEFVTGTAEASSYRVEKPLVGESTIEGIDRIRYMFVAPWTSVKMHIHDKQWEVLARISHKTAHVCLMGEEHELVNNSGACMVLMAIEGHINYSYEDLAAIFYKWGFSVTHGSLVVNN